MNTRSSEMPVSPDASKILAAIVGRRKILQMGAGAAAIGAMTTLLAACSPGGAGGGATKELTFWNFYGPNPTNTPASQWYVDTVDAWNKSHDVKIKLRYIANADYVNGNTLQTAFASGSGPDIFLLSPGDFLRYYNGGVLLDLTPKLSKDVIADYRPGTLDTRMVDDKIFALPLEADPLAIFYSKAAFREIGLTDADVPKTWEDLLSIAKRLTTGSRFGVGFETAPGFYQNFTWYPFMWQGAGEPVGKDGKSAFDSESVEGALQLWGDAISSGVAPKKFLGTGCNDVPSNLGSGYVAMQQSGIWAISAMRDNAPDFEYGVFPLPTPPGGEPVTDLGGWAFCANAKGPNPDIAAEFIVWAVGSSDPDSIDRGRTYNTEAKSNIPVRQSVLDAATAMGAFDDPNMKYFANELAPTGRGEPRYPPEIIKAISDAIQAVQLGGEDAGTAAAAAADTIDTFLANYTGAPII